MSPLKLKQKYFSVQVMAVNVVAHAVALLDDELMEEDVAHNLLVEGREDELRNEEQGNDDNAIPNALVKRLLRDTSDPFRIGDNLFRKLYRMPPPIAMLLITRLEPYLSSSEYSIPIHLQVLSVLRFMAVGSYQNAVCQEHLHPMSQSTFSKYLHLVVPAINALADEFIAFPRNTVERQVISNG